MNYDACKHKNVIEGAGMAITKEKKSMNHQVKNSYTYTNDEIERQVNELYAYYKLSHKRSINSYIREWKAHNWLYRHNLFTSHTRDVDLNDDESLLRRIGYFIVSLLEVKR